MSVQKLLRSRLMGFAGLTALVSARVHPGNAPQNSARPYVTYQVISEAREYGFGGGIGIVQARYQFDVWAEGHDQARAIVDQLRLALDFWADPGPPEVIRVTVENVVDGYEPDTGFFHPTVDFLVIYRE